MTKNTTNTLFILSLLLFMACNSSGDEDNLIIDINDEFNVSLLEKLDPNDRTIGIYAETIATQECENTLLEISSSLANGGYAISINDLDEPTDCLPATAPATGFGSIATLHVGNYNLEINLKDDIQNKGVLFVSNDKYRLVLETDHGITLLHDILYKIPKNTIWGYIGFHRTTNVSDIRDNTLEDISDISLEHNASIGNYGHYYLNSGNSISVTTRENFSLKYPFIFSFEDDKQLLIDLVEDFRATYPSNEIVLKIFSSEGEEF